MDSTDGASQTADFAVPAPLTTDSDVQDAPDLGASPQLAPDSAKTTAKPPKSPGEFDIDTYLDARVQLVAARCVEDWDDQGRGIEHLTDEEFAAACSRPDILADARSAARTPRSNSSPPVVPAAPEGATAAPLPANSSTDVAVPLLSAAAQPGAASAMAPVTPTSPVSAYDDSLLDSSAFQTPNSVASVPRDMEDQLLADEAAPNDPPTKN